MLSKDVSSTQERNLIRKASLELIVTNMMPILHRLAAPGIGSMITK